MDATTEGRDAGLERKAEVSRRHSRCELEAKAWTLNDEGTGVQRDETHLTSATRQLLRHHRCPRRKKSQLGMPTVVDRFIQQAVAQVVQQRWEPHFHPNSYGFWPGCNAHQAMRHAQGTIRQGYDWVVDLALEAFFARVNHDRLMVRVRQHVDAPDVGVLGPAEGEEVRCDGLQAY